MAFLGKDTVVIVRVLGREGQYPEFSIRRKRQVYAATSDLVWAAVVQPPLKRGWHPSEVVLWEPEEIRLFASLALCEQDPFNAPWPIIADGPHETIAASEQTDLRNDAIFAPVAEVAARLGAAAASVPTWRTGEGYAVGSYGSRQDALALLRSINPRDQLLVAGLSRLLAASRLLTATSEYETASLALFVSMGTALEFLRLHLSHVRGKEASFGDVQEYFRATFEHGEDVVEYFQEGYNNRIAAVHPASRLGEHWTVPLLMVDDVYHMRKTLMGLYRHLLLGETEGW